MKNPAYIAPPLGYFASLVRIWQVRSEGKTVWRASLEDPHTHERISFSDLEGLVAYLRNQTTDAAGAPSAARPRRANL